MTSSLPPGYWAAIDKYFDPQGRAAINEMDAKLRLWRAPSAEISLLPLCIAQLVKSEVAEFQNQILSAVRDGDLEFVETLLEAMRPDYPLNPVRAALISFESMLDNPLPTKSAVRRRAIKLLKEAGRSLPPAQHWPRIFAAAGLADLLHTITYLDADGITPCSLDISLTVWSAGMTERYMWRDTLHRAEALNKLFVDQSEVRWPAPPPPP
jgi:hypothetical protein